MDNITGFGGGGSDEINFGLNFSSNAGSAASEISVLDQAMKEVNKDGEVFKGIQTDSLEKAKAINQEVRETSEAIKSQVSAYRSLRGEQEGVLGGAKQLYGVYQQLNNELTKSQQTQARMGITSTGTGPSVPGSSPGAQPINTSSPSTQAGGVGGGGRTPPGSGQTAGFAEDPDNFFGREEIKSGGRRSTGGGISGIDIGNLDASDLQDFNFENALGSGPARGSKGRIVAPNEQYKKISDLALAIFPGQGYYSRLRRARWLARNESGLINKLTDSRAGHDMGLALNRLGGGQKLMLPGGEKGYQLFPFSQNENGDYVDDNGVEVGGQYGLKDSAGKWLSQGGEGVEQPAWAWGGEGPPPPMPTTGTPQDFNPWSRPNLTSTGEGAAKIAGSIYALKMAKNRASSLFQEGQLYTGITGGTGIAGALKYDLGAQATSWFGLNPLESYGQAKQINMQNLALGYRGNLLNQANAFGNQALQTYGVDPQTSMQMFGQMVMQAGASVQDLQASLATLANTASTTNTSFSQLQQNVIQYSQIGANVGLTGGQNATFATAAAQFAAGQPGLAATGANPTDILDSMVGQALVAQQMGTSYLGLPGATQQQGAGGLIKGEVKANEQLFNNMGITKANYASSTSYQRFKLVMASLGMTKEANLPYGKYLQYMGDTWSGKLQKEYQKSLTSKFDKDIGGKAGESAGQAIANAVALPNGELFGKSLISQDMEKVQNMNKWKNIGVTIDGKFKSLDKIDEMPTAERESILAKVATGDIPLSHKDRKGRLIQGNYQTGTLLDKTGHSNEQFNLYGRTPNREAMAKAEGGAMKHVVELGPNASKYLKLLENPSSLNRTLNNWAKGKGLPSTEWGNQPAPN